MAGKNPRVGSNKTPAPIKAQTVANYGAFGCEGSYPSALLGKSITPSSGDAPSICEQEAGVVSPSRSRT